MRLSITSLVHSQLPDFRIQARHSVHRLQHALRPRNILNSGVSSIKMISYSSCGMSTFLYENTCPDHSLFNSAPTQRGLRPRPRFAAPGRIPKGAVTRLKLDPGKFYPGTPHNYAIYVPAQY